LLFKVFLGVSREKGKKRLEINIPWFAVYFILVIGFNSLELLPKYIIGYINLIDTFLLTMAMTALGMGTVFSKFKDTGATAFYTALTMYIWLVVGGFFLLQKLLFRANY